MMPVQLIREGTKISTGGPMLVNDELFTCSHCDQAYKLHYSPGESNRLKEWILKASKAVSDSHPVHPDTVAVPW
jgi:hypothetical protein